MNKVEKILSIGLYSLYFALVGILCFFIVHNAEFILGDQMMALRSTAIGKFFNSFDIMQYGGNRFFPLGHLDVNLALLFGGTPAAHLGINIPTFLILSVVVLLLCYQSVPSMVEKNIWIQIVVIAGASLIITRVYEIFLDFIYPEKILCTMLAIFLYCGIRFFRTNKWIWGVPSLLAASYATFCKEPLFGSLWVFALVILLFAFKQLKRQHKIYLYVLLLNGVVFLTVYCVFVYSPDIESYKLLTPYPNKIALTLAMLRNQKMITVAWLFAFWRAYKLIFARETKYIFYDAMLLTGCAYFCEMVIMNGYCNYFYTPSIIFTVPAIVYFSLQVFKQWGTLIIIGSLAAFYTIKVPKVIYRNQTIRTNNVTLLQSFVQYKQSGYKILWYESGFKNSVRHDYFYKVYNVFIKHSLKEEFQIKKISSLIEYENSNYVLLYDIEDQTIDQIEIDSLINAYSLQSVLEDYTHDAILVHKVK